MNKKGQGSTIEGGDAITLVQFNKLEPSDFYGPIDPLVAKAWLKHIEKIFVTMGCDANYKVLLASFILQREVDLW